MRLNGENEQALRKRVYAFLDLHPTSSKSSIVVHFRAENIPRSTIYRVLRRKEHNICAERAVGSGCTPKKMNKKAVKRLEKRIDHKDGISQRLLAKQFGVHQSSISRTLKQKTNIRYRKKIKAPKRTPAQAAAVRPKCGRLVKIFREKTIILDDESFFTLSNSDLSGNAGFYTSNIQQTPNDVKLKRKSKFEEKLLVWVAFSKKGISQHYIVPSGQAINEDVYINKCLTKLERFITKFHENDEIVFWPDLASSHYSNKTQAYLRSKSIEYVAKVHNPANVPELRPIEDFWAELKRAVYAKCWKAENLDKLRNRIEYCIKKIDSERVHSLGASTFTRVDAVRRHGMTNL